MPDREKVIKEYEVFVDKYECFSSSDDYVLEMHKAVLALLKEQEAVKPKKVKGYNPPMYTIYEYECEKCKSPMMNKQPFCMGCGRSVKWNE